MRTGATKGHARMGKHRQRMHYGGRLRRRTPSQNVLCGSSSALTTVPPSSDASYSSNAGTARGAVEKGRAEQLQDKARNLISRAEEALFDDGACSKGGCASVHWCLRPAADRLLCTAAASRAARR